jgi:thiosulfate dehydrogenase [quinone] large subunit
MKYVPRVKVFALLRTLFGVVWLIDAWVEWQPAFLNHLLSYFTPVAQNQPPLLRTWINWWISIIGHAPHVFAIMIAAGETAVGLSLITGVLSQTAMYGGIVLMAMIWSVGEGFGGLASPGATDVGPALIYVFMLIALLVGNSSQQLNLGSWIQRRFFPRNG